MKQSLSMLLALGFCFQVNAQTEAQVSGNFLKPPEAPKYENCGSVVVDNGMGGSYQVRDQACLSRNEELERNYNAMVEAYNRSTRMMTSDAGAMTKPAEPKYEICQAIDNGQGHITEDHNCLVRNQSLKHDYDIQMSGWNYFQSQQVQSNQAALEAQAQAESASKSATDALQKAIDQNKKAASKARSAAQAAAALSVSYGVQFAGSCAGAGATCDWSLLAASVGFGMVSSKSSRQAGQNDVSGYEACVTQSKISTTTATSSCGADPSLNPTPAPNVNTALVPNTFDQNGNCVTDKATCNQVVAALPPGTNIKNIAGGASAFATSPPYKKNADGSYTMKNGKTLKADNFTSMKSLMAAGLTADQAKSALGLLSKGGSALGSALEKASSDLKKDGKDYSKDFNGFAISGSGSSGADGSGSNALGVNGGSINSTSLGGGLGKEAAGKGDRNPAGEGLTRDFNGETIGAAGDDIFSMMNRRYRMKTAQDSFISN